MASGISNTFRTGGLAIGVAALGALFERKVGNSLAAAYHHPVTAIAKIVSSSGVEAAVKASHGVAGVAGVAHNSHVAFVSGMHLILVIGTIVVALGALVGFALVHHRDFQTATAPPTSPATANS
jgi:hypothetical protein